MQDLWQWLKYNTCCFITSKVYCHCKTTGVPKIQNMCVCTNITKGVAIRFGQYAWYYFITKHLQRSVKLCWQWSAGHYHVEVGGPVFSSCTITACLRRGKFLHRGMYNENKICNRHAICISCDLRSSVVTTSCLTTHQYCKHSLVFSII